MKKKQKVDRSQRIIFMTSNAQVERIHRLSEATGAPLSEIMRRAVDNYLDQQEKEKK